MQEFIIKGFDNGSGRLRTAASLKFSATFACDIPMGVPVRELFMNRPGK